MKVLEEIYGLFVDDPVLALMGLVALAAGALVAHAGLHVLGGLVTVAVIVAGLTWSVARAGR
jgi:CBS-domain-containing membrane protein